MCVTGFGDRGPAVPRPGYRGTVDGEAMELPADIPVGAVGPHATVSDGVAAREQIAARATGPLTVGFPEGALCVPGAVTLYPDGRVELDPDVDRDDAARAFWDAVRRITGWENP